MRPQYLLDGDSTKNVAVGEADRIGQDTRGEELQHVELGKVSGSPASP